MPAIRQEQRLRIRVQGGQPLTGVYHPSGSINAALALLAAALLSDQPITLHNVPRTSILTTLTDLAQGLGASVSWDGDTIRLQTESITRRVLTTKDTQVSVGAILFLAPILVHRRHARLEFDFPLNRIRTHLEALRDLGLDVINIDAAVECKAIEWDTRSILLTQASVTATALVMMLAACLGEKTTLHNAACEPQIQALARFLVKMGAQIDGIGSNTLTIHKMSTPQSVEMRVPSDHIEAASITALAALTGGRVQVDGTCAADMAMIQKVYRRLGITLDVDETSVFVPKHEALIASNREEDMDASIETAPWPGFPSDLVGIATVIATQARGTSLIHEKLFSNRLIFVDKLKAMGAQIVLCDPHRAIVVGATPLRGIYMDSPDVRTGMGLLAAALVANGTSEIDNAQMLERWFVGALEKLRQLNAQITYA
jgi:UDP-N-acetylglucosamine 1-carboxyvinyltransferase